TNLGFYQPATIGDLAFWDMNKSGIQSSSDPGASNVTVQLLQGSTVVNTATTNAQGIYGFGNLAPGTYSLKFIPQNGAVFTLQDQGSNDALDSDPNASGVTPTFTVTSGETDLTHDAGLLPIDLSVTKTVSNSTPAIGSNVTFTITVSNASGYSP